MDFWEELIELPEQGAIQTKGGMRISFSKKELTDYFGPLLEKRPLEQLIGETSYWVLIPSIVATYVFPLILYISANLGYTFLASWGLMISFSMFNQSSYNYGINKFIVRPLVMPLPKLFFILFFAILMYRNSFSTWLVISPFIWWIIVDRIPILYLATELLLIKIKSWMYNLADPDGVLRQVGWFWAKKYGLNQGEGGKILK